jgi:hypothetical protein
MIIFIYIYKYINIYSSTSIYAVLHNIENIKNMRPGIQYFFLFLTAIILINFLLLSPQKEFGVFKWASLIYIIPSNFPTFGLFFSSIFCSRHTRSKNVPIIVWIMVSFISMSQILFFIYSLKKIKNDEGLFSLFTGLVIYLTNLISIWMEHYILRFHENLNNSAAPLLPR